jgi:hypothetical protein
MVPLFSEVSGRAIARAFWVRSKSSSFSLAFL